MGPGRSAPPRNLDGARAVPTPEKARNLGRGRAVHAPKKVERGWSDPHRSPWGAVTYPGPGFGSWSPELQDTDTPSPWPQRLKGRGGLPRGGGDTGAAGLCGLRPPRTLPPHPGGDPVRLPAASPDRASLWAQPWQQRRALESSAQPELSFAQRPQKGLGGRGRPAGAPRCLCPRRVGPAGAAPHPGMPASPPDAQQAPLSGPQLPA